MKILKLIKLEKVKDGKYLKNYELTYELKEFNQGNFYQVLEMLKNTKESCLFKTKKEDLKSFETFKARQSE